MPAYPSYHMKNAIDPSVSMVQSEDLRRWLLLEDHVLFHAATFTLGAEGLKELAADYVAKGDAHFEAAKAYLSLVDLNTRGAYDVQRALMKEALALLQSEPSRTRESLQLEWVSKFFAPN